MKNAIVLILLLSVSQISFSQPLYQYSWKYYTPGTTGILGDYAEGLWIDHDGDPYIAAYTPGWEEGGFSKYIQQSNQWVNYSNVEYPVIGSTADVGSSRISDIAEDAGGILWMATWRGILKFDPAIGGSSLMFWGVNNSLHPGGRTMDIDIAPDGSVWAVVHSVTWGGGGLVHFNPQTNAWQYWGYGSTANNWPNLIGFCEHVSIQQKPAGGYMVWIDGEGWNTMITFDSETQLFTLLPQNYVAGEVVALPGNDCIDEEGNLWALRVTAPGDPFSLDYRTPEGTWITPSQPSSVISDIWAFKAFGNHEALITGLSNEVFQFTGTAWQSKGIWRPGAYSYALDIDDSGNIWVTGVEGAAKRDAATGLWQRHRITNSSQIDYFVEDLTIDNTGDVWLTGNAGPGVGGFQKFDGTNWTGFNEFTYGLGFPFPFPTDNAEAICYRPSNGNVVVNPMFNFLQSWNGVSYSSLNYTSSKSRGLAEDSQGRLWSLGENSALSYFSDATQTWTNIPFPGIAANIRKDVEMPGTVWACSGYEVLRTDGDVNYTKTVDDFQELDPQSDVLTAVIPAPDGIAWVGSNKGLFRLDAGNNAYQFYTPGNSAIQGENITPLVHTPDGRVWFTNFQSTDTTRIGLCWFDGTQFGVFPVEAGGLPHAQIPDVEVKEVPDGYELWMSCLSRGIAVLHVVTNPVGIAETLSSGAAGLHLTNYPNPLTTSTTLDFSLEYAGHARISIYDLNGKVVRNLVDAYQNAGISHVDWDRHDNQGNPVVPGIYIGQLTQGRLSATIQMVVR
jgi:streptogramin lyase